MRKRVAVALAASLALVALVAPSSAGALTVSERETLEESIVDRINTVRRSHGLRPLTVVPRLSDAADRHTTSMAAVSYFRHELYTPGRASTWSSFGTWIHW